MKHVKCKSGLTGWQCKLQKNYDGSFEQFKSNCQMWGIHTRLGFKSMKSAWEANPTIQGSTDPSDLSVVYFHVVVGKNSLRIKQSTECNVSKVKGSRSSFQTREGALSQINNTELK